VFFDEKMPKNHDFLPVFEVFSSTFYLFLHQKAICFVSS